jgi:hypothetical protein
VAEARQARAEELDHFEDRVDSEPRPRLEAVIDDPLSLDSAEDRLESLMLGLEPPSRRLRRRLRRRA